MFRKARDEDEKPALGRAPTPPGTPIKTPFTLSIPPKVPASRMAIKSKPKQTALPTIGRQGPSAKKTTPAKTRTDGKPNSSILSFFKKAENDNGDDGGLFVEEKSAGKTSGRGGENREPPRAHGSRWDDDDGLQEVPRFNESEGSNKRRKVSDVTAGQVGTPMVDKAAKLAKRKTGPFVEESDSEEDEQEEPEAFVPIGQETEEVLAQPEANECASTSAPGDTKEQDLIHDPGRRWQDLSMLPDRPLLIKEETSYSGNMDEFKDFEGVDDFDEDLFEEGDEYMERRYMEEQTKLEAENDDGEAAIVKQELTPNESAPSCPVCSISLAGVSEQNVGVHVNNCLDGNPSPLPEKKMPQTSPPIKSENMASANQYKRPARPPKPGQANPFTLGQDGASGGSAFNKLMSGHAEDAAWAEAAASEHASRGKPSYQRTCPFYKILPGLFICVDAFRYGAVSGCQAYFLSHFHSDHYIGLTSHWTHGPIYCSRVTGNLVRQQLRVNPKYVIDLEFDKTIDVPKTKGVKVTMIPANHCPGSSLYLFEKVVGKQTNGDPRLQRILHCGDFRACKAHVGHPLLMPDVQDKLTGKTKEQKIDVCYLDTTYLNPKYAFPPQSQVIEACSDMCVSLSKCTPDATDGWEQMKRQRAGEGMVKFVSKEAQIKAYTTNDDDDETKDELKLANNAHASQQILSSTTTQNSRGRLLVVVGTYSIGKERICIGIAKALNSKIYAPTQKQRIVAALEDPELNALMTTDPRKAQVHMTPLFEIRAETLDDYLKDFFPHFTRCVGFRPSGWNYRPPNSRFLDSPPVAAVLNGDNWRSTYRMKDLVSQRGSTSRASCFGVPYSEHSSFRELTMFCVSLRIERVIPTVNVGSAKGRERMKGWCERWAVERRKSGVWKGEW